MSSAQISKASTNVTPWKEKPSIAPTLILRPEAAEAWTTLTSAIHHASQDDLSLPCSADADAWYPPHQIEPQDAARLCQGCPVSRECLTFAEANDERHGVWGGVHVGDKGYLTERRRAERRAARARSKLRATESAA